MAADLLRVPGKWLPHLAGTCSYLGYFMYITILQGRQLTRLELTDGCFSKAL